LESFRKIVEELLVTPSKESAVRVVESPPEIERVDNRYLEVEPLLGPSAEHAQRLWLLWEHRRFLFRVALWGLITSTVIAFLIPNRYESTTRLMPPDTQSGSGMAMIAALMGKGAGSLGLGSMASDLLGTKSSGALFVEILKGRTIQDRLIERFDLRRVYWDRYFEDARKDLAKRSDISEDRKSGVIEITVTDRDPHRAALMAQAYVEELDRLVAQVSTSAARRERIFIEQRLQTVKADLTDASRKFSEYASKNETIDMSTQAKATVEAAAILEGQMIAAQSELDGLEQIYTKNNVRVRSAQARVEELRSQLHKIGGDSADPPPDNGMPGNKPTDQEFPSIRQLPLLGVKWADLYREAKIQETVYELLTQQYEIAKIEEAKEIPVVKVVDKAFTPEKKSSPHRLLLMVLGTLTAGIGGVLWTIGAESWRQIDSEDPRKQLGQEVLSSLVRFWSRLAGKIKQVVSGNKSALR
jgi:capsule polysaccharide export protein KpsE/RkpR